MNIFDKILSLLIGTRPTKDMEVIANATRLDLNKRGVIGDQSVYIEYSKPDRFWCTRTYVDNGVLYEDRKSIEATMYVQDRIDAGFYRVKDILRHFKTDKIYLIMTKDSSGWVLNPFSQSRVNIQKEDSNG